MTLSFTEQERIYMIYILQEWRGDAPYDGTIKQSDNPSREEAEKLLEKFEKVQRRNAPKKITIVYRGTPEERRERHE